MTQQARTALMCLAFACCEADWCLLDAVPGGASDTDTSGGTDSGTVSDSDSVTTGSPSTRFDTTFTGAYKLVDGASIVVNGWTGLTSGMLEHAINLDETGSASMGDSVWSNTKINGTIADADTDCFDWSSIKYAAKGRVGDSSALDASWSDTSTDSCGVFFRLYCFEGPA